MASGLLESLPGYEAVLKAVLKKQIQVLIDQLRDETGEETLLLTTSLTDGSFSNLGSGYGQDFLEEYRDIKSKFYGFCVNRHKSSKSTSPDKTETVRSSQKRPPTSLDTGHHHQSNQQTPIYITLPSKRNPVDSEPKKKQPVFITIRQDKIPEQCKLSDGPLTATPIAKDTAKQTNLKPTEITYTDEGTEMEAENNVILGYEEAAEPDISNENTVIVQTIPSTQPLVLSPEPSVQNASKHKLTAVPIRSPAKRANIGKAAVSNIDGGQPKKAGKTAVMSAKMVQLLNKSKHECDICGRLFLRTDDYKKHMRCHTGEKPFTCRYCGQKYQLKTGHDRHVKKQHSDLLETIDLEKL